MMIKLVWGRACPRPVYLRRAGSGGLLGLSVYKRQNSCKLCLLEDSPDVR